MFKKIIILAFIGMFFSSPVFAKTDKCSKEYLQEKKHFAIMNPIAESFAQRAIKKSLKKETDKNFKVKFDGYTLSSMKQGVFKNLELTGEDFKIDDIDIVYLNVKTVTDYNYIDYKQKPIMMKSDMVYAYEIHLNENSINTALDKKDYKKVLEKVNSIAYPMFVVNDVRVRVKNSRAHIIVEYNFPLAKTKKDRTFAMSSKFKVDKTSNKIIADDVSVASAYSSLQTSKVANLINLLDPLSFTLNLVDKKKCNGRIENVKIVDDIVQVSGKIFVKAES
jgi:hypothetical protein